MIKLYYTSIRDLTGKCPLAHWQQKKAATYKKKDDTLRSVAASLLINTVLFDGLPAPAPSYGSHGKPYFSNAPEFNISHAGDLAVLAVASLPVGIDIERNVKEDYLSLGKVFLCDYEYQLLEKSTDKCALFYHLWTRKESYLKMTGTGLNQEPKSFGVLHDPPGFHFFMRQLSPGYTVAICSALSVCEPSFTQLHF